MLFERWVRQFAKDGIERLAGLRRMALNGSEQNRRLMVRLEDLDARTLEVLAKQGPADVRILVARHPNLHADLARSLLLQPRITDALFKEELRQRIAAWEAESEPDEVEEVADSPTTVPASDTPTSAPALEVTPSGPSPSALDEVAQLAELDLSRTDTRPALPRVPIPADESWEHDGPAAPMWTEPHAASVNDDAEVLFEAEAGTIGEQVILFDVEAATSPMGALEADPSDPLPHGPFASLDDHQLSLLDSLAFADDPDEVAPTADVPPAPDLDERVEAVLYGIFDRHFDGISPGLALDALRDKISAKRPGGLIRSLRNLVSEGADPEAIVLAYAARSYWQETHVNDGRRFTHLDWRTAVRLMESFEGYPDLDEAIQVLEKLGNRWRVTGCTYSLSMYLQRSMEELRAYRASGGTRPPDLFFS